jgi:lipopolysaccharide transport system ATP-binding protein
MGSIIVSNVSKAYKQYSTRWARLAEWCLPGRTARHSLKWVLQDISFTVQPGEALGIIGLNGAGKSTLLKIITGTSRPTAGGVEINGRVAALLELGIGFHPDFTGRQNVFMAGQLLGYGVEEIAQLMPGITAFAEIGDYLDQPVRVYSSGMQMRLAFSVATARRPDVLIVDEALSVGDAYFQHKSFDRIREFQKQGTTLLIVSHDKQAIQSICDRAILLNAGSVLTEGPPEVVMDYYNAMLSQHQGQQLCQHPPSEGLVKTVSGTGEAIIRQISICDLDNQSLQMVFVGQPVKINIVVDVNEDIDSLVLGCGIKDRLGQMMFGTNTFYTKQILTDLKSGQSYLFAIYFPANLGVGSYSIHASLVRNQSHIEKNYHWIDGALVFEVFNKDKTDFVGCNWNEMTFDISTLDAVPTAAIKPESAEKIQTKKTSANSKILVVDIGCRWGFAEKFIAHPDIFHVVGFDPDLEECSRLRQRYQHDAVTISSLGLAGIPGKRTLYRTQEPACSSLLRPDSSLTEHYPALRCAKHISSIIVETTTLDNWAEENLEQAIDYIKIDTQGTELEILQGAVKALKTARCIDLEVEFNPIYTNQPLFSDIDQFLRNQDFMLWKLSNLVHYSRDGQPTTQVGEESIFYDDLQQVRSPIFGGQLFWANAHYVKKDVLDPNICESQKLRDAHLFQALGMPDVVKHLEEFMATRVKA